MQLVIPTFDKVLGLTSLQNLQNLQAISQSLVSVPKTILLVVVSSDLMIGEAIGLSTVHAVNLDEE